VVGVVAERMPTGGSGGSQAAEDFNNDVYIPIGTAAGRFGKTVFLRQSGTRSGEQVEFSQVTLTVSDTDEVRPAGEAIKTILDRHLRKDTELTVPLDRLEEAERAKDRFTMLLGVIAFISLVVGGIGIMNIMLAAILERTREIGVRRAVGARQRDIVRQFIVEAVLISFVGGLLGIAVGFGMSELIGWFAGWSTVVTATSILLAFFVSISVGLVFGIYPALKAARLDPVEAIRYE